MVVRILAQNIQFRCVILHLQTERTLCLHECFKCEKRKLNFELRIVCKNFLSVTFLMTLARVSCALARVPFLCALTRAHGGCEVNNRVYSSMCLTILAS